MHASAFGFGKVSFFSRVSREIVEFPGHFGLIVADSMKLSFAIDPRGVPRIDTERVGGIGELGRSLTAPFRTRAESTGRYWREGRSQQRAFPDVTSTLTALPVFRA